MMWMLFLAMVALAQGAELRLVDQDLVFGERRLSDCRCYLWLEKEGGAWWAIRATQTTFAETERDDVDRALEFEKWVGASGGIAKSHVRRVSFRQKFYFEPHFIEAVRVKERDAWGLAFSWSATSVWFHVVIRGEDRARSVAAVLELKADRAGWRTTERAWRGDHIGHATVLYSLEGKKLRTVRVVDP